MLQKAVQIFSQESQNICTNVAKAMWIADLKVTWKNKGKLQKERFGTTYMKYTLFLGQILSNLFRWWVSED